jgi:CBS domain-containing protein
MKVRDVMTKIVITATPEMSFKETAELLLDYGSAAYPWSAPTTVSSES